MYQVLGLIATFICLGSIFGILCGSNVNIARSISHHAARSPKVHFRFAVAMSFGLILFGVFSLGWFVPHFDMSWAFNVTLCIALLFEAIATWIPLTKGWKFTAHQVTSYGTALLIPVVLLFIAGSDNVSQGAAFISAAGTAIITTFIFLFVFAKSQRQYYLIYQVVYILCFFVGLMSATYLT